jgi:Abnormal spindle-like microcephaly-assoc'd, ASPM-SPD-2-Hydin
VKPVLRVCFAALILVVLGNCLAPAQTAAFDFNLLVTVNGNTFNEPNNTPIGLVTQVGTQTSATVMAVYTGAATATITGPPSKWLLGSTQFKISVPTSETFPLVLTTGQALTFTVTFAPTDANGASAQLQVPYSETNTTGAAPTVNIIGLSFTGQSPAFTLSYALAPNNNIVQIQPGGTIPFPPTLINTTATGELLIINTGSGPGVVNGVSLAPSSVFSLSQTPFFPFTLTPGTSTQSLPIFILYTPKAVETDTGLITITYQGGATATVNLTGTGTTSTYTYTYLNGTGGAATPVAPGGTITLPSVTVPTSGTTAASSNVVVTVKNTGSASGVINSIQAVPSPPFGISGAPVTPPTLAPGGSPESFSVTFTPTQVGTQTGTLVVGNDTFVLSGTGLGPQLTFSYVSGGATIAVGTNNAVVFPSVPVGQSEKVTFTVTNSGTTAATISLVSTNAPFSVPVFSPTTLAAGKSTSFPITFTPTTESSVTGSLLVNNTVVSLVGAGTTPSALPSYTFTGPSGNVSPASQDGVSLTLAKPYGTALNGVLTLTTSGEFGTDPSVQFVTSGRTVDFTIPANSTSADFAGQGSQILLQTGTVAETVTLTPSFTTSGGVDVTPASPTTLQFTIPSSAPVLESVQVTGTASSPTSASFTLVVVGYSTTRSLSSLNVTFNPASGFNLANTQFPIDVSGAASVWFQSTASQTYGGQFEVSVPFNLTGSVAANKTLLDTIASVSATVSNSIGTSSSLQANVQ